MYYIFLFAILFSSVVFALEKHDPVYFLFDSSTIPDKNLNLKVFEAGDYFLIEGYSDPLGEEFYNLQLSKERAESVKEKIATEYDIDKSRIKINFYGEDTDFTKPNKLKRRADITSGSINEINRIINGADFELSSNSGDQNELEYSESNQTEELDIISKPSPPLEEKEVRSISSEDFQNEKNHYKRNSIGLKINSFHSELSAKQTSGVGVGSSASGILTDPNLSGEISYGFKLTKPLEIKIVLDFKNYIFSSDLDTKIAETQKYFAFNPGINLVYSLSPRFKVSFDLYSFDQAFYGANGLGNLIFDYDRLLRFEFQPEYLILNKKSFNLGFGAIGTYHSKTDNISSAFGWGSEVFINAFYGKKLRFHVKYYDIRYDFVSSKINNELLELGIGYKWAF